MYHALLTNKKITRKHMNSATRFAFTENLPASAESEGKSVATRSTVDTPQLFSGRQVEPIMASQAIEHNIQTGNAENFTDEDRYTTSDHRKIDFATSDGNSSDPASPPPEEHIISDWSTYTTQGDPWLTDDELILKSGYSPANLNQPDQHGLTPLMHAIEEGNKQLVELMLKKGALTPGNKKEELAVCYAIDYALQHRRFDLAKNLLHKGYPYFDKPFHPSNLPLHRAIRYNDIKIISRILESNIDPNLLPSNPFYTFCPYLLYATTHENTTAVELLLRHGADPDTAFYGDFEETALHMAIAKNNLTLVKILLRAGADPDLPNSGPQWTPLIKAAHMGHDAIVELLIAFQANPNLTNGRGRGPLQLAIHRNHFNIVSRLIEAGADFETPNEEEWLQSPLGSAIQFRRYEITRLLLNAGARLDKQVIIDGTFKWLQELLQERFSSEQCAALLQERSPFPRKHSLQKQCRRVIRAKIRKHNGYEDLPIPYKLQVFCRDRMDYPPDCQLTAEQNDLQETP